MSLEKELATSECIPSGVGTKPGDNGWCAERDVSPSKECKASCGCVAAAEKDKLRQL